MRRPVTDLLTHTPVCSAKLFCLSCQRPTIHTYLEAIYDDQTEITLAPVVAGTTPPRLSSVPAVELRYVCQCCQTTRRWGLLAVVTDTTHSTRTGIRIKPSKVPTSRTG